MRKLTKKQKMFLKTIKNEVFRQNQKQQFILQNDFDNNISITNITQCQLKLAELKNEKSLSKADLRDLTEPKSNETIKAEQLVKNIKPDGVNIDEINYTISSVINANGSKLSLNKDALQGLLDKNPSLELLLDLKNICVKFGEFSCASIIREKEKELRKNLDKTDLETPDAPKVNYHVVESSLPKKYTSDDMENCFFESRLTHPIVGFKHDTFSEFIVKLNSK